MKIKKFSGIIVFIAMIGVAMTNCDNGTGDTTAPSLGAGFVNRTSNTTATIDFITDKAGTAYYLIQISGAAAPANTVVKVGTTLGAVTVGANKDKAVTLTAGAKDIYVVVEDSSGNISSPLKIEAAAFTGFFPEYAVGDTGPGGGIIFYVSIAGFTVTGTGSFTAHYLEAAPLNMATRLTWCSHTSSPWCNVNTGTAIGTGKANTAAIIAAHSGDTVANNAAKACSEYINNYKTDWFLPSKDELNEMYKARTHLGISDGYFWSSSQDSIATSWIQYFDSGYQNNIYGKFIDYNVRAIRAF